jgi:hypothetical protein
MKKITLILGLLIVTSTISTAQNKSKFDSWPAIKEFHKVMSQTFHPSEEGNLEPIKKRSGEMVEKANILSKSEIPNEFSSPKIKDAVKRLAKDSKKLHKLVLKKKSDKEISEALSKLHDVFHEIVGLCTNEEHH